MVAFTQSVFTGLSIRSPTAVTWGAEIAPTTKAPSRLMLTNLASILGVPWGVVNCRRD
jgi:hypothetical protein